MAEVKGLNIKLGLDTTELASGLSSSSEQFKKYQRDLRQVQRQMESSMSPLKKWAIKQKEISSALKTTSQRLSEEKRILAEIARSQGDASAAAEKHRKEIEMLNGQYNELQKLSSFNAKQGLAALGKGILKWIAVIAGVIAAVKKATSSITSNDSGRYTEEQQQKAIRFEEEWTKFKDNIVDIIAELIPVVLPILRLINQILENPVVKKVIAVIADVLATVALFVEALFTWDWKRLIDEMGTAFTEVFGEAIRNVAAFFQGIFEAIGGFFKALFDDIKAFFTGDWGNLSHTKDYVSGGGQPRQQSAATMDAAYGVLLNS